MVLMRKSRFVPYVLALFTIITFCFFAFLQDLVLFQNTTAKIRQKNNTVISYSLLKKIEIESKTFSCFENPLNGDKDFIDGAAIQWTFFQKLNLYVYSIHYDNRLHPHQYLRIIAMQNGSQIHSLFCQSFSSDGRYHITQATITKIWNDNWSAQDHNSYLDPYLISCHVPSNFPIRYFSLNKAPCNPSDKILKIPIFADPPKLTNFTICVKPLNFENDISAHLLQWIIINQLVGADKFELYLEKISPTTLTFLLDLDKLLGGRLILHWHAKIDSTARNLWQKRRYEVIAYNDCLYRNIHTSHFIIPIDIDEIIIPRHVSSWGALMLNVLNSNKHNFASYTVRNAYYLRQFNKKRHHPLEQIFFFDSTVRSEFSEEKESGKSFVLTQNTLTVFNHYSLEVLRPGIRQTHFLDEKLVQMNHYKNDCSIVILPQCAKYLSSLTRINDKVIFKYQSMFYKQYQRVLRLISTNSSNHLKN